MTIQNAVNLTTTGIVTADGSGVFTGSTVTQFGVVIANTSNLVLSVAPSATVGVALVSTGAASNPQFGVVSVGGGGTGATSFTAGSVIFSNGTILTEDNANLFWDDVNNRLGIGTALPVDELHIVGSQDLVHISAESDDHALEIDCDASGFGDVKALDIDYITGAMTAVQDEECMLVNIDESASVGGIVNGYEVLTTAEGSAVINGYTTGINVNPIVHESGVFGNADSILNIAVDVTAALASGGAGGISIFVADNDTLTTGDAATWDEFEIILDTGASGSGVAPTFEYSTGGAAFSAFSPADGTNGFRNSGAILFDSDSLAGWATATSGLFEIRITRTRNSLTTTPIIDELQISATTEFTWDSLGDVSINSLTLVTPLTVPNGGTGVATLNDGGIMIGSGAGAVTVLGTASNGQLPIGSGGADPVLASLTQPAAGITIVGSAGAITFALANDLAGIEALAGTGLVSRTAANTYADTSITDHAFVMGDTGELPQMLGPATDGQIPIGFTGALPTLGVITSTDLTVTVANTAGAIDLSVATAVTGNQLTTMTNGLGVHNLAMTFSTPTVTILGSDGAALSASNTGYVTLRSNVTEGELVTIPITSNFTFQDAAGTSVFAGSLFGFATGDNTSTGGGSTIPFFLYAVADDANANMTFVVSRVPQLKITTAATLFDAAGGGADNAYDILALESITVANYDANEMTLIGSFNMHIDGSDDWDIQSVSNNEVGIGRFAQDRRNMNFGVNGASASSLFRANGGTAPTVDNGQFLYKILTSGSVVWEFSFELSGNGATAVDAQLIMPISGSTGTTFSMYGTYTTIADGAQHVVVYQRQNGVDYTELVKPDGTTARFQYDEMLNNDVCRGSITYTL